MGAWVYCDKCECGQDKPTVRQVLEDDYRCHCCDAPLRTVMSKKDALLEMLDRLEAIEAHLGITPP